MRLMSDGTGSAAVLTCTYCGAEAESTPPYAVVYCACRSEERPPVTLPRLRRAA